MKCLKQTKHSSAFLKKNMARITNSQFDDNIESMVGKFTIKSNKINCPE